MTDLQTARKSGRQRVPSRKVAENENAPYGILVGGESDEEQHPPEVTTDDEDFPVELETNDPDPETDSLGSESDSRDELSHSLEADEREDTPPRALIEPKALSHIHPTRKSRSVTQASYARSRIPGERYPSSQGNKITDLAGLDQTNRIALEKTRKQWIADSCLPASGRMRLPFVYNNEQMEKEAMEGWDWYFDQSGKDPFSEQQRVRVLSADEGCKYVSGASQDLLIGPYGFQKLFNLPHLQCLPLDASKYHVPGGAVTAELESEPQPNRKRRRHGWMLNVGTRLQCLDWAPNQNGDVQYLALASSQLTPLVKELSATAPAFTPAPSTPSSLQIWAFDTSNTIDITSDIAKPTEPKLIQILCTDCGSAKQLKWCPMPFTARNLANPNHQFIGLLASTWSDGYARVHSIQLDQNSRSCATTYLKIDASPFSYRPPTAICTTLTWLSPSNLATGHSDGSISLHNIFPSSPRTTATNQAPDFARHQPIVPPHPPSPVLALSPAYPSYPTFLATSSIAGHARLLDLRSPQTDYASSPRTRFPATNLLFSPHLASFVFNEDGDATLRAAGVRLWGGKGAGVKFARTIATALPASSSSHYSGGGQKQLHETAVGIGPLGKGCVDVGKVHTCVAWGGADGRVVVCNPAREVLEEKRRGDRAETWQVCVVRLEWVREWRSERGDLVDDTAAAVSGEAGGGRSRDGEVRMESVDEGDGGGGVGGGSGERMGVSRITQSYRAEKVDSASSRAEKVKHLTVFEEEQGVTAVCWNPNLKFGGWLAVGWGCGLVRVEDVAV